MKRRRRKRKKGLFLLTIVLVICDIGAIMGFILMYGPYDHFRNLFVTTAMKTRNHQYIAYVFYNKEVVQKIMKNNYFVEIDEDVNLDDIIIDTREKKQYKDKYEEELFTRDGNDSYKVINVKVGHAKGYLVAIYKPEKVRLLRTVKFNNGTFGERVVDMCSRYKGSVCINGGGFANGLSNGSDIPLGYVIDDGEVLWPGSNSKTRGNIIGITDEGKLKLMNNTTGTEAIEAGIKYGLEFGPFLIVNGKSANIKGNGGYGIAPRTAIGQRKDGIVLLLVIDGRSINSLGIDMSSMIDIFKRYKAYNAANLDGGGSSAMLADGVILNNPVNNGKETSRYISNAWILTN